MSSAEHVETAVFLVNVLKRMLFAFDCLDNLPPGVEPVSPHCALYFDSIYNYTAQLFLLDKGSQPMGGTAYPALNALGLADLLTPVKAVLDRPIGDTTFGEAVRILRNTAIVHSTHSDSDLDRIYELVGAAVEGNQALWVSLLQDLREAVAVLTVRVALSTGRPLDDFEMG